MNVSVIICAHNPRADYLRQTLQALENQTLPRAEWELLLVDNSSAVALSEGYSLAWHPHGRHILEPEVGLTRARLTGIAAAENELLVFVDDDNVLAPDYLEQAVQLAALHPNIGVFGGKIIGQFEMPPPAWLLPHIEIIAIRDLKRSSWSNLYQWATTPVGAGMVMRRFIAQTYARLTQEHPVKQLLGRKGDNTFCGEDVDMAYTAIDLGYGAGRFLELQLTHLIPQKRLAPAYLLRLFEDTTFSALVLNRQRPQDTEWGSADYIQSILGQIRRLLPPSLMEINILRAKIRGMRKARRFLHALERV